MRTLSLVVISLAMSSAMAKPAAKPAPHQKPAATATQATEETGDHMMMDHQDDTAHSDKCAGKTGKDLETCHKAQKTAH